jgi:hypothetical protein
MKTARRLAWFSLFLLTPTLKAQDASSQEQTRTVSTPSSSISRVPSATSTAADETVVEEKNATAKSNETLTAYGTLIGAIVGGLAAIAAAFSAYYSFKTVRQADQAEQERRQSARVERMSLLRPEIEKWAYLSEADMADLNSPRLAQNVLNTINSMDNVGHWWKTNLIDREALAETAAKGYITIFEQIRSLGLITELNRSGSDLIEENRNAQRLYEDFQKYVAANPVLTPATTANTPQKTTDHET